MRLPPRGVLQQLRIGAHEHRVTLPVGQVAQPDQVRSPQQCTDLQRQLADRHRLPAANIHGSGHPALCCCPHCRCRVRHVQVIPQLLARREPRRFTPQRRQDHRRYEALLVLGRSIHAEDARPEQLHLRAGCPQRKRLVECQLWPPRREC